MLKKKLSTIYFLITALLCFMPLETYSSTLAIQSNTALNKAIKNSTLDAIVKRGVLRVAMNAKDHPPFFMVSDDGELIGIDVELAHDIARQLGVKVEINRDAKTFDGVVERVANGLSDIAISKLSLTLKRALIVRYTAPYTALSKSILINRVKLLGAGKENSTHQIFSHKKAKIAALSGSSYEAFAKRIFPNATIYSSKKWHGDIIPKVIKGELWGAFRDEIEVRRAMFLFKDAALHILAVNLKDEQDPMMMAVNKNAPLFQDWLNLYLKYAHKGVNINGAIERFKKYVYRK